MEFFFIRVFRFRSRLFIVEYGTCFFYIYGFSIHADNNKDNLVCSWLRCVNFRCINCHGCDMVCIVRKVRIWNCISEFHFKILHSINVFIKFFYLRLCWCLNSLNCTLLFNIYCASVYTLNYVCKFVYSGSILINCRCVNVY